MNAGRAKEIVVGLLIFTLAAVVLEHPVWLSAAAMANWSAFAMWTIYQGEEDNGTV